MGNEDLQARVERLEEMLNTATASAVVSQDLLIALMASLPQAQEVIHRYVRRRERFAALALNSRLPLDSRLQTLQVAHEALLMQLGVDPDTALPRP